MSPDEIDAFEARLLSDAASDAGDAQVDLFRDTGGGTIN
jgi:hypothetical protein